MAPLLFNNIFSAMLQDASKHSDKALMIRYRTDCSTFNLHRLKAKTKASCMLLRDLLYADDCCLFALNLEDAQRIVNDFARASTRYELTISIT